MILSPLHDRVECVRVSELKPSFQGFILTGTLSIPGSEHRRIKILQDTGAEQSVVLEQVLSFYDATSCRLDMLVQSIEMGLVKLPLHYVLLQTDLLAFVIGCQ